MLAPNTNSVAISSGRLDIVASNGRHRQISSVEQTSNRRQPNLAANAPAKGMERIEPTPRHSNNRPSVPSSRPMRCLTYGTSGAHDATLKPAMKNAIRVEDCSAPALASWAAVLKEVMHAPCDCRTESRQPARQPNKADRLTKRLTRATDQRSRHIDWRSLRAWSRFTATERLKITSWLKHNNKE
ncbi:hypothetical protein APX70_03575 [Pseudomonas syringae pv. maculicola]|uniref:Uncharacterized protein n=1 Tax=Pseudomonas syringae pv. maculicola TaxID=59511 RepID=A0A3M3AJX1_PSEYM|nr:hypothetical protein APX70_03575 [Pseudomonas syringae pv. maculicola]